MGLTIAIVMHPHGDAERIEEMRDVVHRLRGAGHRVLPRLTFEEGDAVRYAREAARARADVVVAAGGDGTVNEVVNGIVGARWQPRLGIAPVGTANDFATGLGLPGRLEDAVRVAVEGRPIAVDVARVNRRFFINVSTGGFGAEAAESAPHFGEAIVNDYVRCPLWPVEEEPLEPVTAPGAPPILVVSTTGDPATPYEAGVRTAERLESGVLLTYDGDGHTVVANGVACVDEIVADYLVDLEVPEDGTTCTD